MLGQAGYSLRRSGVSRAHTKPVVAMLCMGEHLLSLGADRRLCLWKLGTYDAPQVGITSPHRPPSAACAAYESASAFSPAACWCDVQGRLLSDYARK